jgi:hypothetical protein
LFCTLGNSGTGKISYINSRNVFLSIPVFCYNIIADEHFRYLIIIRSSMSFAKDRTFVESEEK